MRFALMIEPQMGLTYDDQLAVARRAEAAGFETLFRSDHYESFPGRLGRAHHRCLDGRRRPGARHDDHRPRRAGLARDVPDARQPRQGGDHGRRDERRAHRGRPRRRLARGRAPAPRVPVPGDRGAGGPARGDAGDPPRALGRARRLVVHRQALRGGGLALPAEAGRRCRGGTGGRPNILVGGQGTPRSFRIAARYADEFNLSSTSPAVRSQKFAALDEALRAAGRDPSTLVALRDGRRARSGATRPRSRAARRTSWPRSGVRTRAEAWFAARRAALDAGHARRGARRRPAVRRRPGVERMMLQDFLPRDLEMIDLAAEALIGRRSRGRAARAARLRARRRPRRPAGRPGRRGGSGRGSCRGRRRPRA